MKLSLLTLGSPRSQTGMSLVELLVGLAIGLLVVLAATGTLVLNRVASNTISDTAAVTSQAANAMRQVVFILRQASAFELQPTSNAAAPAEQVFNLGSLDRAFLAQAATPTQAQAFITGTNGNGTGVNADTLTVRFENRDAAVTRDCLGNTAANVHDPITSTFSIQLAGGVPNLMCQGQPGTSAQPIAQNVEDFQVTYLTETGGGLQWMDATQVTNAGAWNQVVAANVCIQVRGDVNHGANLVGNYTNCAGVQTPHNNFTRIVVRQTVQLRNRMNNL